MWIVWALTNSLAPPYILRQTWAGNKYSVQNRHLSSLPASRYGAVLTTCCRERGDTVLHKHCFLVVALHFRHSKCHSPPPHAHTFLLQRAPESNVITNWQVKYKSTSAIRDAGRFHPRVFHTPLLFSTLSFSSICCETADAAIYRQWNLKFWQAWRRGLVIILKYRTPPSTLKRWKSH